ncbi:hypothetical protein [Micromonospora sp. NPDC005652]|uniref:hypothetical protein n=1 Tax=Micromonospora sp. NPDC005652 TaxID=3157046 RepID=UPI0033C6CD92
MSTVLRALRRAESEVEKLVSTYEAHGCSADEIEAMGSVVKARAEVAFQNRRLRREFVRRDLRRAPMAFGVALRGVLWTDEAMALLPGGGRDYGWNDGGCLILSDALADLLGDAVEQVSIVGNGTLVGQHHLVRFDGWYIDADGACPEDVLLRRWVCEENVHAPRVTRLAAVDVGSPRDREASRRIMWHLVDALRPTLD